MPRCTGCSSPLHTVWLGWQESGRRLLIETLSVKFHVSETHPKVMALGLYWGVIKSKASILESVAPPSGLFLSFFRPVKAGKSRKPFSKGAPERRFPDRTLCSVPTHVLFSKGCKLKRKEIVCVQASKDK